LAKALKDARFPQELPDPSSYYVTGMQTGEAKLFAWSEGEDKPYREYVKCPILEELIEALGRKNLRLSSDLKDNWLAYLSLTAAIKAHGKTANEAAAILGIIQTDAAAFDGAPHRVRHDRLSSTLRRFSRAVAET
jgi:hypothetical protein